MIPDPHAPLHNPKAIPFLKRVKEKYKPSKVICIGDLVDQYQFSNFVKAAEADGANLELRKARLFIKQLAEVFPKMDVCLGNHDLRYVKRAKEAGLAQAVLKPFGEIIGAPPGWRFAEEFLHQGVLYFHGDGYTGLNAAQNVIKSKFRSCVFGHTHQAAVAYINGLFGFNVGCLIDPQGYAFEYAKHMKNRPTIGCGVIQNGAPIFVPLT